jgi:hypothetical protein
MCIIIDANVASQIFSNPKDEDSVPVLNWLFKDGAVVYGGKLAQELFKVRAARRSILEFKRSGRAFQIDSQQLENEEQVILQLDVCRSNDPHVIALARVSGARTLYSHDELLHEDFKNRQLIDKPKGCVYQNSGHIGLLKHTSGCRRPK